MFWRIGIAVRDRLPIGVTACSGAADIHGERRLPRRGASVNNLQPHQADIGERKPGRLRTESRRHIEVCIREQTPTRVERLEGIVLGPDVIDRFRVVAVVDPPSAIVQARPQGNCAAASKETPPSMHTTTAPTT